MISDITFNESVIFCIFNIFQAFQVTGISEFVEVKNIRDQISKSSLSSESINKLFFSSGVGLIIEGSYYLFRYVFYRFIPKLLVVESIICAVLIVSILFFRGPEQEFIYFQF